MQLTEQQRLRLGTELVTRRHSLWPVEPPPPEWIRANVFGIVSVLEQSLRHDGQDARRLPRRLHWWLWLRDDVDGRKLPSPQALAQNMP